MARTHGSTSANKLQRRRQLLPYVLRGITDARELSKLLHCSMRTIQLDLKALKPWLYKKIEEEQLHSLRISFLQKREIWRETWALHDQSLQKGKEVSNAFKIRCLELAMRISAEFDRISGIGQPKPSTIAPTQNTPVTSAAVEEIIAKLSEEEKLVLAKAIGKLGQLKASSRT